MSRHKVLIITSSYIIRSGLTSILTEISRDTEVLTSSNERILSNLNVDVIFLDPAIITPSELKQRIKNSPVAQRPKIILVYFSLPEAYRRFPNLLDLTQTEKQLQEQLNTLMSIQMKKPSDDSTGPLSKRELNILRLVSLGNTNKEIAEKLFISTHTVITHRKNITRKLGIKTVSGLTVYAILNNIIQPEELQQ